VSSCTSCEDLGQQSGPRTPGLSAVRALPSCVGDTPSSRRRTSPRRRSPCFAALRRPGRCRSCLRARVRSAPRSPEPTGLTLPRACSCWSRRRECELIRGAFA